MVTDLTYMVIDGAANALQTFSVATQTFSVTIEPARLIFTPTQVESTQVGLTYSRSAVIPDLILPAPTGGTGTLAYTIGRLPAGLAFAADTRTLSGTPTKVETMPMLYTVSDGANLTATLTFSITVISNGVNEAPDRIRDDDGNIAVHIPRIAGPPNSFLEVDLSLYFVDPDGDPLSYTAVLLDPSAVVVLRINGPMLTLWLGTGGSEAPRVQVTATDPFGATRLANIVVVVAQPPLVLRISFDNVMLPLTTDGGDVKYQDVSPARVSILNHFVDDNGDQPLSDVFRYSVSSSDETVVVASFLNTGLVGDNPLTLASKCEGDATVTVMLSDDNGFTIGPNTFQVEVDNPNNSAPFCFASLADDLNTAILPEVARAIADSNVSAITRRIDQANSGADADVSIGGQTSVAGVVAAHGEAIVNSTLDLKALLSGSNFVLPLNAGARADSTGLSSLAFWGGGDFRNLSGESGKIDWDGSLFSLHLGADARLQNDMLAGLSLSRSQSDLDYTNSGDSGEHELTMTSINPYLGWSAGYLDLWATAGYGTGDLEITTDASTMSVSSASSGVSMFTVAVGGSSQVLENSHGVLRLKGEVMQNMMEVDGSADIDGLTIDANRLQIGLEATQSRDLDNGAHLEPSLEAGVRLDGGDGETGGGLELGAGFRYTNPARSMTLEGRAHTLVGRDSYDELGVYGLIRLQSGKDGQGLELSLRPAYGDTDTASGLQNIWQEDGFKQNQAERDYAMSMDARVGYGLSLRAGQGRLTPYSEMTLGDTSSYRLGMSWDVGSMFDLNLVGEQREPADTDAEHAIILKGEMRF